MIEVHLQVLENCVEPPRLMRAGDAAADLTAAERTALVPGERAAIPTGVAVAIPLGWCGLVLARSGMALKSGISVLNSPGLIDSGYRGEIKVILYNSSSDTFTVEKGSRIAQLLIVEAPSVSFVAVQELPRGADERGSEGFGSSGD